MRRSLKIAVLGVVVLLVGTPGFAERPAPDIRSGEDLTAIRERGVLRLITRNSPNTYFLYRGEQMGFEYDLAKGLASRLGVELEVAVPPPDVDPLDWLRTGRGDLLCASLMVRHDNPAEVRVSKPYKRVSKVVLVRDDCDFIHDAEDLIGRTVGVAEGSRHYWFLRSLELRFGGLIDIRCEPAEKETGLILADLSGGEMDAAVAESDVAMLAMSYHGNLKVACVLEPSRPVGWGLQAGSEELLAEANDFLEDIQGTFFFNDLKRRYYEAGDDYRRFRESVFAAWQSGSLSRFDPCIQKHAGTFGMDWLLVAALIYEESSFNPSATSSAGARGLLQIMPRTAAALGLADPHDPDESIFAGVRYLKDQCESFRDVPTGEDRLCFALASYNIGAGHVRDAQRLAAGRGLDPHSWESVAPALQQLSRREFYEQAEYGYCRGGDAVRYVKEVLRRWEIYSDYLRREGGFSSSEIAISGKSEPPQDCLSAVSLPDEEPGA